MLSLSPRALADHDAHRVGGPHAARCLAPFTSMYFDQFGNVLACCINTMQPLGSYPAQHIDDIWRGAAAEKLREALAADDFSLGCHDCHSSIASGNYGAVNATFDRSAADTPEPWLATHPPEADDGRDPWPRMLEFALSTRCNLTCTMCNGQYSSAIQKANGLPPLPEPYDDAFIEQLRPYLDHVTTVRFYGGEPFLSPLNYAILEILIERNPTCSVHITTNGTIWNERVQRILETLPVTLMVSIDGYSPETYEAIRQGADREKVFRNLDRFAAIDGCDVTLAVCAMRQNWHELPDLVRFANRNGWGFGFNVVRYPQDHSLSSADEAVLTDVVALWSAAFADEDPAALGGIARQNLRNFGNLVAEARGWLAEAGGRAASVEIRSGSNVEARARRRAWLDLVAAASGRSWDDAADQSEDAFAAEMDGLLGAFDEAVPREEQGPHLARALAARFEGEPGEGFEHRFDRFAALLGEHPVTPRIRLMTTLPPALIAQGVAHEDPATMQVRFDAYFPPQRPTVSVGQVVQPNEAPT